MAAGEAGAAAKGGCISPKKLKAAITAALSAAK